MNTTQTATKPLPVYALAVRELRRRFGWTRRQLAQRGGWSKSAVANWELGACQPGNLAKLQLLNLAKLAPKMAPQTDAAVVACGCGQRHRSDSVCPVCKCWSPSPSEIAAGCELIQRGWTAIEREKRARSVADRDGDLEIPVVPLSTTYLSRRARRAGD
jgi:DNA-binding transcriptional regulator YiaG